MPQYDSTTKIYVLWSLYQNGVSPEDIPDQLNIHRATVYRWIKGIRQKGIKKFIRDYKQAKKGRRKSNKTDVIIKLHIYEIRHKNKDCCGEKIQYFLEQEYNEKISVSTIYRILNERYILRSQWKKYCKRGYVRRGTAPREAVQTDTVDLGELFAYTSIDTFTKEASVIIQGELTSKAGKEALKAQLNYFKSIEHIQRDGGHEFKGEWQAYAVKHIPSIRTARPYKKNEQAFIERFNGILRKECLGYTKYRKQDKEMVQEMVNEYLQYYHEQRPHMSLNMQTPKQFAMSHLT